MKSNAALSRRRFLAGTAAAGAGVTATTAAFTGQNVQGAPGLDALWRDLREAEAATDDLYRQYHEATDRLPWWAAPGPSTLFSNGALSGQVMGWPAIQGVEPSKSRMAMRRVRVGFNDIKRDFESSVHFQGRPRARSIYRRQVRSLVARLRAQRDEKRKVGLPEIDARLDRQHERREEVLTAIDALPFSPDVLAARLLIHFRNEVSNGDGLADFDGDGTLTLTLELLAPVLSGEIANAVSDLLADPLRPVREARPKPEPAIKPMDFAWLPITDELNTPSLHLAETALIDKADREPADGELFALRPADGLHTFVVTRKAPDGQAWFVGFENDPATHGPLKADELSPKLIGKVVSECRSAPFDDEKTLAGMMLQAAWPSDRWARAA